MNRRSSAQKPSRPTSLAIAEERPKASRKRLIGPLSLAKVKTHKARMIPPFIRSKCLPIAVFSAPVSRAASPYHSRCQPSMPNRTHESRLSLKLATRYCNFSTTRPRTLTQSQHPKTAPWRLPNADPAKPAAGLQPLQIQETLSCVILRAQESNAPAVVYFCRRLPGLATSSPPSGSRRQRGTTSGDDEKRRSETARTK